MKTSVQQGFTLIELIVVIVILGILSATALPKFIDLGKDARASVVQAVEGSMRSANAMVYAKAAVANKLGAADTVNIPGTGTAGTGAIETVYGFATDASRLARAMDLDADKIKVTPENGGAVDGMYYAGYARDTCGITYAKATSTTPPTYTTVISGC